MTDGEAGTTHVTGILNSYEVGMMFDFVTVLCSLKAACFTERDRGTRPSRDNSRSLSIMSSMLLCSDGIG